MSGNEDCIQPIAYNVKEFPSIMKTEIDYFEKETFTTFPASQTSLWVPSSQGAARTLHRPGSNGEPHRLRSPTGGVAVVRQVC